MIKRLGNTDNLGAQKRNVKMPPSMWVEVETCVLSFFLEKYDLNSFLLHQQPKFSKEELFLYSPPHRVSVLDSYITFTPSHALLTPISLRLYWVPGRKHRNMSHVPSDKELTIWTGCPFHILYLLHSIFQALMLSLL